MFICIYIYPWYITHLLCIYWFWSMPCTIYKLYHIHHMAAFTLCAFMCILSNWGVSVSFLNMPIRVATAAIIWPLCHWYNPGRHGHHWLVQWGAVITWSIFTKSSERHIIARPLTRDMVCFLQFQSQIYIVLHLTQQKHKKEKTSCIIISVYCLKFDWSCSDGKTRRH